MAPQQEFVLTFSHSLMVYDSAFDRELRLYAKYFEKKVDNLTDLFLPELDESPSGLKFQIGLEDNLCINKWEWKTQEKTYILMDVTIWTDDAICGMLGITDSEDDEYEILARIEKEKLILVNHHVNFASRLKFFEMIRRTDPDENTRTYFDSPEGQISLAIERSGLEMQSRQYTKYHRYYWDLYQSEFTFLYETNDTTSVFWDKMGWKTYWSQHFDSPFPQKIYMQVYLWKYKSELHNVYFIEDDDNFYSYCFLLEATPSNVIHSLVLYNDSPCTTTSKLASELQKRHIFLMSPDKYTYTPMVSRFSNLQ